MTDGQDCGWVDFPGIGHLNDIIGIFPDEDTLTVTKVIAVDMEAGRDVLRNLSVVSQTLVGRVTDGQVPMSYVTVYLKENPNIGTVSDLDGVFTLSDDRTN